MSNELLTEVTYFVLAIFVGIEVISKVPSVLHTPLMSGTNAIHGIILVGAIVLASGARGALGTAVAAAAVLLATMNVVGGFVVTDRMLEMFKQRPATRAPQQPEAPALVAAGEIIGLLPGGRVLGVGVTSVALFSVLIGCISFAGSLLAFAKLQELMTGRPITFPWQKVVNGLLFLAVVGAGSYVLATNAGGAVLAGFAIGALLLGVLLVLPVGGADMPVIISLLNSFTGLAAATTGFVIGNN